MKSRVVISFLLLLVLVSSCKKEKEPSIIGVWYSEARIDSRDNAWTAVSGLGVEMAWFYAEGGFNFMSDVPLGNGTYSYDRASGMMTLHYDYDRIRQYPPRTITVKLKLAGPDKMIITYSEGTIYETKVRYARITD